MSTYLHKAHYCPGIIVNHGVEQRVSGIREEFLNNEYCWPVYPQLLSVSMETNPLNCEQLRGELSAQDPGQVSVSGLIPILALQ